MCETKGYGAGTVIAAFVGGAAAGAVFALLTAPHSGRETRQQVGEYIHEGKEAAARLPHAVRAASDAAREALRESLAGAPPQK